MKIRIFLFLILILATFLRVWKIGEVPLSPDWDEVALGYNAYSLMQTGRDEYGEFLPVVLRSFDDYKPALYSYLTIPSILFFGLNTEAVRLPSIIFGVIAVIATFFLVKELFKRNDVAILSALLFAISPWHIQFSRVAFEANVGVTFNILGILFFLYGLRRHSFLFLSSVFFGAGIYVYQAEKVFVPLIILTLVLVFREKFLKINKKYIASAAVLLFLIILPMIIYLLTNKDALLRARGVSVFTEPIKYSQAQRFLDDQKENDFLGILFDNRRVIYGKRVVEGYLSHFDLNWLFIRGDLGRHHAPFMGLLYLAELPFLLLGLYLLVFKSFDKKAKFFILGWFLLTPIPASITSGVPHAIRVLNFLPTFQIFTALGLLFALQKILNIKYKVSSLPIRYPILIFLFSLLLFNVLYYLNQYFVQQNYYNAKDWQYGYKEAVSEVKKIQGNFGKIVVENRPHVDQSYMFFLFYLKYPPSLYQEAGNPSGGFAESHRFGKYEFRPIHWDKEDKQNKILYIGRPSDFPESAKELRIINFPNGEPAIKIVES